MDVRIREERRTTGLQWPFVPWFLPLWYGGLAFSWWQASIRDLNLAGRAGQTVASLTIALALAGKLTAWLVESSFYHYFWKGRGRRLPFWRFFCVVVSASSADLLSRVLAASVRHDPTRAPWLAWLAGLQLAHGPAWLSTQTWRALFGTLGLLTISRLSLTAQAQRAALGLSFAGAMGWTAVIWLLTRVALFFAVDLMSGMSPLSKG